jgi:hypothetical protein
MESKVCRFCVFLLLRACHVERAGQVKPSLALSGAAHYFRSGTLSALVFAMAKSLDSNSVYMAFWREMIDFL